MDIIKTVFAEQWVFMVIAVLGVALTFAMKHVIPKSYQTFLKGELVLFSVALILLAFLKKQDLFLLVPIIIICCELFGYDVTGKIVGVLFIDFLLIQLDFRVISQANETLMNIIFFLLQIVVAVCIGIIMDGYLKSKTKHSENETSEEKDGKEEKNGEEEPAEPSENEENTEE